MRTCILLDKRKVEKVTYILELDSKGSADTRGKKIPHYIVLVMCQVFLHVVFKTQV